MAETITIKVPHKHSQAEARRRIDKGFAKVQQQITGNAVDVSQTWADDVLSFKAGMMGQSITGKLNVMDDHVLIEVDLPWLLAKLSGTITDKMKKATQLLLDKK
ncbi:MAG: polyhydroxyalkanoic acid system family protein [Rhizobiaceae bacterium]